MISKMNLTAFAAIMEATGFSSIYLVNLSTVTKVCMNLTLAALKGPARSSPSGKGPSHRYGLQLTSWNMLLASEILTTLTMMN
jgi:hypothetical protein